MLIYNEKQKLPHFVLIMSGGCHNNSKGFFQTFLRSEKGNTHIKHIYEKALMLSLMVYMACL